MFLYIRIMDIKEYKRQWYVKNEEELKDASKENYHNNKESAIKNIITNGEN
jgi:hypothetical protein